MHEPVFRHLELGELADTVVNVLLQLPVATGAVSESLAEVVSSDHDVEHEAGLEVEDQAVVHLLAVTAPHDDRGSRRLWLLDEKQKSATT